MGMGEDGGDQQGEVMWHDAGGVMMCVILDEMLVCPVVPDPIHVEVGTFPDFCWERGHWP